MQFYRLLTGSLFASLLISSSVFADKQTTIVGGEDAKENHYPFMVSLQQKSNNFHFCGGSLLNETTVITAAHCTVNANPGSLQVALGKHSLSTEEDTQQIIDVKSIVVHPDFSYYTLVNDVSIIHLAEPAVLNKYVQPINLPEKDASPEGYTKIIGWGTLKSGGQTPDILQKAKVKVVDFEECAEAYGSSSNSVREGMMCAAAPGKDSCQGDSGGPLFKGRTLLGLTSWGYGCAQEKYPGVYTNVSSFVDFIGVHLNPDEDSCYDEDDGDDSDDGDDNDDNDDDSDMMDLD